VGGFNLCGSSDVPLLGFNKKLPNFPIALNNPTETHSLTKVIAMDDDRKDVAIIEASALLVTLIFIILSLHLSYYAQWYAIWQQGCSSNPQCTWPTYMATMSAFVGSLEPYAYLVGFFFVVSASAATIRLFSRGTEWVSKGLRPIELVFFLMGLFFLAVMFFANAQTNVNGLVAIALLTLVLVAVPLLMAYRNMQESQIKRLEHRVEALEKSREKDSNKPPD
jgi:glucan phosphoethanolaminetransferase (alkaline phosphatase superfamily)